MRSPLSIAGLSACRLRIGRPKPNAEGALLASDHDLVFASQPIAHSKRGDLPFTSFLSCTRDSPLLPFSACQITAASVPISPVSFLSNRLRNRHRYPCHITVRMGPYTAIR